MQALEGSAQKSWEEEVTLGGGNNPWGLSLRTGCSGASADSITTQAPQVRAGGGWVRGGAGGGLGMFPSADLEDPCLILKHFNYFSTDINTEWPRALIRSGEWARVWGPQRLGSPLVRSRARFFTSAGCTQLAPHHSAQNRAHEVCTPSLLSTFSPE